MKEGDPQVPAQRGKQIFSYEQLRTVLDLLQSEKSHTIEDAISQSESDPERYKKTVGDAIPIGSDDLIKEYKRLQSVIINACACISFSRKISKASDEEIDQLAENLKRVLIWECWQESLNYFGFNITPKQLAKYKILLQQVTEEKTRRQARYREFLPQQIQESLVHQDSRSRREEPVLSNLKDSANSLKDQVIKRLSLVLPDKLAYLYFKRWSVGRDIVWYKIGITIDPGRRDAEQNVLPVAAETLKTICFTSIDFARIIESMLHKSLKDRRVDGAKNREIFDLNADQYDSVIEVLEWIDSEYGIRMPRQFQD